MFFSEIEEHRGERCALMGKLIGELPHPEPEGGLHLIVSRAAGMDLLARLPHPLHQKSFNCGMTVLITLMDEIIL